MTFWLKVDANNASRNAKAARTMTIVAVARSATIILDQCLPNLLAVRYGCNKKNERGEDGYDNHKLATQCRAR